ncbi:MAG: TIGR02281 family clan AA aspartic protease [Sphingomonadales bacterium]|uniref:retropepsin-like aspartic protease family protein n=1 Tax=Novosphingobium sp. NDB2Meth1 TaxID=1892847 RepID=UPI0009304407|nr:TIGR02281 family clan AA aspartic protease [Novosphingobium sp. NDB2Meth1]MBU6395701.1 TIGR02281 family clan AA aspartic protease [Sphingomonadales bacterium]MBY0392638.1 TIGR02281 family clan AA aspartic protease [Novosphingobium sp.]
MNRLIVIAGLVVFFSVLLAPGLSVEPPAKARTAKAGHSSPWSKDAAPPTKRDGTAEMVEIARDSQGQFHLEVDVGGESVRFLVDTGADVVALTEDDAERLGLRPDPSEYRPMLQTASGTGLAAPVEIDRLTIGGRELTGVAAVVVPDLSVSLLGQSALRRLGSVTLQGDRLIIAG